MTTREWYSFIIQEKEQLTSLDNLSPNPETITSFVNDLKTQSKVAIWRLSAWVFAFMAYTLEQLWEEKRIELQDIQDNTPPHNRLWWNRMIKAFQYGDTTIVDENGKVTYEEIDEDKQLVKLASIENVEGVWNALEANSTVNSVKIYPAKSEANDVWGNPIYSALTLTEADALRNYVSEIKPVGVKVVVDENSVGGIYALFTVYYDPKVINYGGTLVEDTSRNILQEQMSKFINEDVNPNQAINKTRFKAYLTQGVGIKDVDITTFNYVQGAVSTAIGRNLDINGVCIGYEVTPTEPIFVPDTKL